MTQTERPSVALRIAALCFVTDAGFGIAMPFTLTHLPQTGELPMTPFRFRWFSGPFEQLSRAAFTSLGWALLAVCALDVLAGVWIWRGKRRGARLGWRPPRLRSPLGVGFALPFLLLLVPIRTGLVLTGWRGLR